MEITAALEDIWSELTAFQEVGLDICFLKQEVLDWQIPHVETFASLWKGVVPLCDVKWSFASTVSLLMFTQLRVCSGSYEPECLQLKVNSESTITAEIAGILICCNSLLGFHVI